MNIQELKNLLKEKGFKEESQDTGVKYSLTDHNVELVCYIEPNIEIEFISLYKWDQNDVKGTYNISVRDFTITKDSVLTLFRKTKNNMPKQIGEAINVHTEIDKVLERIF